MISPSYNFKDPLQRFLCPECNKFVPIIWKNDILPICEICNSEFVEILTLPSLLFPVPTFQKYSQLENQKSWRFHHTPEPHHIDFEPNAPPNSTAAVREFRQTSGILITTPIMAQSFLPYPDVVDLLQGLQQSDTTVVGLGPLLGSNSTNFLQNISQNLTQGVSQLGDYFLGNNEQFQQLLAQFTNTGSPSTTPLEKELLKKLPAFPPHPSISSNCIICLESCITQPISKLPCSHIFHHQCIQKWLKKTNVCPICRDTITSESLSSEYFQSIISLKESFKSSASSSDSTPSSDQVQTSSTSTPMDDSEFQEGIITESFDNEHNPVI